MGFLNSLGNFAAGALNELEKSAEEMQALKERYERLDDRALIRMARSYSGRVRIVCCGILRERGYDDVHEILHGDF